MEVLRQWVEAADTLLLVAEASADGLRNVQHVGNIVPTVGVVHSRQVLSQHARSILFEQANQTVRSRPAVQPKREGIFGWFVSGLEEPVKDVDLVHVSN